MPTPEQLEVADLFLSKAASDLTAARSLAADAGQQDDVVGFHGQQAVEKSIKAVLAVRGLELPRTHDLSYSRDLPRRTTIGSPTSSTRPSPSPWAVAMRYDEMEATLDRKAAIRVAGASLSWAKALVAAARTTPPDAG